MIAAVGRKFVSLPALLFVIASLVILMPGHARVYHAAGQAYLQGDVTCDATVNSVDSLQILGSVAGLDTSAGCLEAAGDVNCDTAINSADSLRILRHVAGLSNTTPDGCVPIGESVAQPTSYQLIDQAVNDDTLDTETGLIYKFYASFGDSRLPVQYRGNDDGLFESPVVLDLPGRWDTLSQGTRDALSPFLKTPPEPGSWFDQGVSVGAAGAADWLSVDAPTVPVKFWYHSGHPQDAQNAQAYIAALEGTIWPSLANYMGRQPLPDCGAACPSGGGDARLDIYLVDESVRSMVTPQMDTCDATPVFMLLARDRSNAVLAHEFMHTIQFAFDAAGSCNEYHWFMEASAQWAMDHVYPGAPNEEQVVAPDLLDRPDLPLDLREDPHWYGAYLFPFYLTRIAGQANAVRAIWDRSESSASSLSAINDVMPGGFEGVWPDFALKNWNLEPVEDYHTADGLNAGAMPKDGGTIVLSSGGIDIGFRDMEHLSAVYYDVEFSEESRSVLFRQNRLSEIPGIKVWAIRRTGAGWQTPEDWTTVTDRAFCSNQTDIAELVLIISNSDWQGGIKDLRAKSPSLSVEDHDCTALIGNVETEVHYHGRIFSVSVSGLRLTLNPGQDEQGRYLSYTVTESPAVTWHASGDDEFGCTVSGEMHLEPANGNVEAGRVNGFLTLDREERDYDGFITGYQPGTTLDTICGGFPGSWLAFPDIEILWTGWPSAKMGDGPIIEGEYVDPSENYGGRWTWHFEPAP